MKKPAATPESCAYCKQSYTPKRRWIQKYCSGACRVAACNQRTGRPHPLEPEKVRARRRARSEKGIGRTPSAVAKGSGGFQQQVLAAGLGALGANAVTQTAEYLAITKSMADRINKLEVMVSTLAQQQAQMLSTLGSGVFATLQTLGLGEAEIKQVMKLPASSSKRVEPQQGQLNKKVSVETPPISETDAW